jgi:hypothetical protein
MTTGASDQSEASLGLYAGSTFGFEVLKRKRVNTSTMKRLEHPRGAFR